MTEAQKRTHVRRITNQRRAERKRNRIEKAFFYAQAALLTVVSEAILIKLLLL